jgi:hypothetical protein
MRDIQSVCGTLGIAVNMKKTRIARLSDGVPSLKGKYKLPESGKILRLPGKESAKRMRGKLKKLKALIDEGKMNYAGLRTAYQSWRGGVPEKP